MRAEAEAVRLRYRYRRLILRGELRLPLEAATALVGPDCAYHLYRGLDAGGKPHRSSDSDSPQPISINQM